MPAPDLINRHPVVPVATISELAWLRDSLPRGTPRATVTVNNPEAAYAGAMLYTAYQVDEIVKKKVDDVYHQRNLLAIALARLSIRLGLHAGAGYDEEMGRSVVYVETETGDQLSWHMSDDLDLRCSPLLPLAYAGDWDGTYKGREELWPLSYIPLRPNQTETLTDFQIKTAVTGQGRLYAAGLGVGIPSSPPESATHYREDSAGKTRYYFEDPVTGWHYYHHDADVWYPTDLGHDYLVSHIKPLAAAEPSPAPTPEPDVPERLRVAEKGVAALDARLAHVEVRMAELWKQSKTGISTNITVNTTADASEVLDQLAGLVSETAMAEGLRDWAAGEKVATKPIILIPEPDFSLKTQAVQALMKHLDGDASVPFIVAQATHICIRPGEGDVILYSISRNAKAPVCWLDRDTQRWEEAAVSPDWVVKNCLLVVS